jgi:hypothetical protein
MPPLPTIGLIALCAALVAAAPVRAQAPAPAELREPVEPAPDIVKSGQCRVPVCTDFDFGDHAFRVYAPARPPLLRFIPKGACRCASVRRDTVKDKFEIDVETADGTQRPNVGLVRVPPAGESDADRASREADRETTHERFVREAAGFKEAPFTWNEDSFAAFRVYQRLRPAARPAITDLYFVPRDNTLRVRGQPQPVAFRNPLGSALESGEYAKDGPRVSARLRLTPTMHFYQFFIPRLTRSDEWMRATADVAAAIEARLGPKP